MKQVPFLTICVFFCLGIILSEYITFSAVFTAGLLSFLLVVYFAAEKLVLFKTRQEHKTLGLMLICLLSGFAFYNVTRKENSAFSLENNYLKGDLILGQILSKTSSSGAYAKCEFEVNALIRGRDTVVIKDKAVVFLKGADELSDFDVCLVQSDLDPIRNKSNPGEFDSEFFWKHKGITYIGFADEASYAKIGQADPPFSHVFTRLRNYFSAILDKHLSGDELGVAKALILGDRSSLDAEITGKFGNTGAMHILAVSGLHVGILIQILTSFFGLFKRWISKNRAILISLAIVWIYSLLTGFSASVVRSVVMFSLLVGSQLLERNYNNYNVLAFSAVVILVWNPHFLFDIGFQLSYLAMLGIFMFYKPLGKLVYFKNKIVRLAYEGTMVGIAAQIMTVPLTLYYFHQFPNYFILTNLGLMVFSFVILVLGVSLFSTAFLTILAKPIAGLLSFSLTVMLLIIHYIDALPGAVSSGFVLNSFAVLVLFALILLLFYALYYQRMRLLQFVLLSSTVFVIAVVHVRYSSIASQQICFFQSNRPVFAVKLDQRSFVFYADKNKNPKQAEFLGKSFQKIYPAELQLIEISGKKETRVAYGKDRIKVRRDKGGYTIRVNDKSYFYMTSLDNFSEIKTKVSASWLEDPGTPYCLKQKAVQFLL
ncbi:MAG: ComEC/Rec2-related protein [Crocinitomicaceae bacterium]|jgi:competence protein ComEC|nr:ComEC/Rec2-related protein [Crocinitomicaceae bacterium]